MKISMLNSIMIMFLFVICGSIQIDHKDNLLKNSERITNEDIKCSLCTSSVLSYNYSGKLICENNEVCTYIIDNLQKMKINDMIKNFSPCNICFRASFCHIKKCKELSEIQEKVIENLVILNNNEIDINLIEKFTNEDISVIFGLATSIKNKFALMKSEIKKLNILVKKSINIYFSKLDRKHLIIDIKNRNNLHFDIIKDKQISKDELINYTNTISTLFISTNKEFDEEFSKIEILMNKLSDENQRISERNKTVLNEEINISIKVLVKKINSLLLVYDLLKKIAFKVIIYK